VEPQSAAFRMPRCSFAARRFFHLSISLGQKAAVSTVCALFAENQSGLKIIS
jgi:hypothetical protein